VEPSHDIAFTREVGEKVGEFMMDGCSDLSVPASQELSVPNSGQATRMNGSIGVN